MIWKLDLRDWRAFWLREVRLLFVGKDLVKIGWETVERMWDIWSLRGWEEGSLGESGWLVSWNWARLGWMGLEWYGGLEYWDQKYFQQRKQHQQSIRSDKIGVLGSTEVSEVMRRVINKVRRDVRKKGIEI